MVEFLRLTFYCICVSYGLLTMGSTLCKDGDEIIYHNQELITRALLSNIKQVLGMTRQVLYLHPHLMEQLAVLLSKSGKDSVAILYRGKYVDFREFCG